MTDVTPAKRELARELVVFSATGERLVQIELTLPVTSLSGAVDEADHHVPAVGARGALVKAEGDGVLLLVPSDGGRTKTFPLRPGVPRRVDKLTWLVLEAPAGAKPPGGGPGIATDWLADWLLEPMRDRHGLENALRSFLSLLARHCDAKSGMLVLFEGKGARLVSWHGMRADAAEELWRKLPATLTAEILKREARMILPEDITPPAGTQSTLFVRGIHSVAGFPVAAEGQVLALLLLGFRNIVAELTVEAQQLAELGAAAMGLVLQRALLREQLEARSRAGATALDSPARLMVGRSRTLDAVYHQLHKLAPTRIPVLIRGETGTGKELAARELHRLSPRAAAPFIAVNAAALPENLIEAELFGYRRGAFTGAIEARAGLIEQAEGGTLFIDEVGELTAAAQAKLLRVLQERAVHRLGEDKARPVDFRLVSATHCRLKDMVAARSFREDLFYRLAGAEIELPPLRERREDIPLLANLFKARCIAAHGLPERDWSQEAQEALIRAAWPGNIRELQHACERAVIMADGPVIRAADLGAGEIVRPGAVAAPLEGSLAQVKEDWLRLHLSTALERHAWNKKATARSLGIGLRTLFRYIEQLDLKEGTAPE